MFNSIGVICKPNDFTSQKTALELGVLLKDLGVILLEDQQDFEKNADLIIVVGGDGTILNTARTYVDFNIPILGVNLGRLGFLADVSVDSMTPVVSAVLNGEFIKETVEKINDENSDQDFFSAIKLCKKKRIGPARTEDNRPLFFKKDIS